MLTQTKPLTPYQVRRYSRHIIMPQVGSQGQRKLLDAKVLIVGAGGLGSPISIYLTLAGVGTIGIVDFDTVDVTNLQRQILHYNDDVGRPKVESARDTLLAYNPDVNVIMHEEPLTSRASRWSTAAYCYSMAWPASSCPGRAVIVASSRHHHLPGRSRAGPRPVSWECFRGWSARFRLPRR